MNVLTLSIKQKFFDEILAGTKRQEFRELTPKSSNKHILYVDSKDGKEYSNADDIPDGESQIDVKPIGYDALKLCTGAYKGKRPYIIVEIVKAEVEFFDDENGEPETYEYEGKEYLAAQIIYSLGNIIEQNI